MDASNAASVEALVQQAYRWILGREGDPEGVAYHANKLRSGLSDEYGLRSEFFGGAEFQHHSPAFRLPLTERLTDTEKLIPFGTTCYVALLAQQLGLRSESYPFDWIFSSAAMIADCLEDDFEAFLDPRYHRSTPSDERADPHVNCAQHTLFFDRYGIANVFNHRDITQPEHLAYFRRSVDRLRKALASEIPALLVMLSPYERSNERAFERLVAQIEARGPHRLLSVNILQHSPQIEAMGFSPVCDVGAHKLVSYRPVSYLHSGYQFESELDATILRNLILQHVRR